MNTEGNWEVRASGGAMSRRDVLRGGAVGAGGLVLGSPLAGTAPAATVRPGKAKSVIQIWMWGGPAHLDTFDPKPGAGRDYCGPLDKPIETNVKGTRIGQMLPLLAKKADKFSIIRSMTHGVFAHETASYMTQTGRKAGGRDVYPCVGAVVSLYKGYDAGYKGLIPPYIVMTRPQGRFSEAGFLGSRYKPFATGGDPGRPPFLVEGVAAPGITKQRQKDRRKLLGDLDALRDAMKGDSRIADNAKAEDKAYDLILGDAGKVFDVAGEKQELRESYGRHTFGQSCLIARRLVERGVPYIAINYRGWDTHKGHFESMRRQMPQLDQGLSTLLQDLEDHGLLDSTIVWWSGEFGRGPKVQWKAPWNGGRSHYGHVFSSVVAGGGFKGGQVVGASDAKGEYVKDRPVYPCDLIGSMYELLGIDTGATLPNPQGLPLLVSPTKKEGYKMGGRLKEIM
jgi:hypothetical protein